MPNTKLDLQLQGDTIFTILRMIRWYAPDEVDVLIGNVGSARLALRFSPPELPKFPLPPADDRFWFYYNQIGSPFSPDPRDQGPEQPVPVSYHRFLRLAPLHDELLSERKNPDH
jgi:hypothetical protein